MKQTLCLQAFIGIAGLVPVGAGLAGVFLGPAMVGALQGTSLPLDSHYRYLSGLLLGIGLGFWSCIPDIGHKTERFRLLTAIVFIGGLARLYALMTQGVPDGGMMFGLAMELVVTPLLALGQARIACRSNKS